MQTEPSNFRELSRALCAESSPVQTQSKVKCPRASATQGIANPQDPDLHSTATLCADLAALQYAGDSAARSWHMQDRSEAKGPFRRPSAMQCRQSANWPLLPAKCKLRSPQVCTWFAHGEAAMRAKGKAGGSICKLAAKPAGAYASRMRTANARVQASSKLVRFVCKVLPRAAEFAHSLLHSLHTKIAECKSAASPAGVKG